MKKFKIVDKNSIDLINEVDTRKDVFRITKDTKYIFMYLLNGKIEQIYGKLKSISLLTDNTITDPNAKLVLLVRGQSILYSQIITVCSIESEGEVNSIITPNPNPDNGGGENNDIRLSNISFIDAGDYFISANPEDALQEIGKKLKDIGTGSPSIPANVSNIFVVPEDYGAIGDLVADDSVAIKKAIIAARGLSIDPNSNNLFLTAEITPGHTYDSYTEGNPIVEDQFMSIYKMPLEEGFRYIFNTGLPERTDAFSQLPIYILDAGGGILFSFKTNSIVDIIAEPGYKYLSFGFSPSMITNFNINLSLHKALNNKRYSYILYLRKKYLVNSPININNINGLYVLGASKEDTGIIYGIEATSEHNPLFFSEELGTFSNVTFNNFSIIGADMSCLAYNRVRAIVLQQEYNDDPTAIIPCKNVNIINMKFSRFDSAITCNKGVHNLHINNCTFENCVDAIYADGEIGDLSNMDQSNSLIYIKSCIFNESGPVVLKSCMNVQIDDSHFIIGENTTQPLEERYYAVGAQYCKSVILNNCKFDVAFPDTVPEYCRKALNIDTSKALLYNCNLTTDDVTLLGMGDPYMGILVLDDGVTRKSYCNDAMLGMVPYSENGDLAIIEKTADAKVFNIKSVDGTVLGQFTIP